MRYFILNFSKVIVKDLLLSDSLSLVLVLENYNTSFVRI